MKKIFLFTANFPYGSNEPFLETEILIAEKLGYSFVFFPLEKCTTIRSIGQDSKVVDLTNDSALRIKKLILTNLRLIVKIMIVEFWKNPHRWNYIKEWKKSFFRLIGNIERANSLENWFQKHVSKEESILAYSYWFADWSSVLAILKYRLGKRIQFITRIHAYDYDPPQHPAGWHIFRFFELQMCDKVIAISSVAKNYMMNNFSQFTHKFTISRLGTIENKIPDKIVFQKENTGKFILLSCSSLIFRKRVDKIIDSLQQIQFAVKWMHFGSGELELELKSKAQLLPQNIEVEWIGEVSNSQYLTFLRNNADKIDAFINTSLFEGIPVTIMESFAFGIPVIAPAINGIPEIVDESNGILLSESCEINEIVEAIQQINRLQKSAFSMRISAYETWLRMYSAQKNYTEFYMDCIQH